MTLECQTLARACGKSHVHNLEPEDLVALTVEAAAMARVPLAGTELDPRLDSRAAEISQPRPRSMCTFHRYPHAATPPSALPLDAVMCRRHTPGMLPIAAPVRPRSRR